jgi:hypothetical protein
MIPKEVYEKFAKETAAANTSFLIAGGVVQSKEFLDFPFQKLYFLYENPNHNGACTSRGVSVFTSWCFV